MYRTKEINEIKSHWFSLPDLIKEDIFKIEIKQSKNNYDESIYNDFIVECDGYSIVTNKYRKLKSNLFGCYC